MVQSPGGVDVFWVQDRLTAFVEPSPEPGISPYSNLYPITHMGIYCDISSSVGVTGDSVGGEGSEVLGSWSIFSMNKIME